MLLNYLKLSLRLLLRNPFFTFINILGMSLGFAAFLVLWQYTSSELKSDQFHKNYKNKIRLVFTWKTRDDQGNVANNPNGLFSPTFPKILASEYEDFENYTRLYHQADFSVQTIGDHGKDIFLSHVNSKQQQVAFKEENLAYADPNLFEFFSLPLVEGGAESVLTDPSSIVLSESMARKYFGEENVTNRLLLLNDSLALKVSGVFKDLPHNTHLTFDAVISINRISRQLEHMDDGGGAALYFEVKSNSTRLDEKADVSAKKYLAPAMTSLNIDPNDLRFFFQPLDEIAFSQLRGDIHQPRSRTILIALRIVSIVILITAWINYLNLVIYANSKRMKELGVRKTSGARNSDFIIQFVTESLIINTLSILGGITLVQGAKTSLQDFFQVYLSSGGGISINAILVIILVTVSGIVISGVYPALTVMNKSTRNIFSGGHQHNFSIGKWLTVFQFSVAIILMISIFAIYNQLSYILNKDLGMKRDEVIVMDLPENSASYPKSSLQTFLSQLSTLSDVTDFALSSSVPGDFNSNGIQVQRIGSSQPVGTDTNGGVDERFLPFYNIKLLAGRNFINDDPANEHAIIVSKKLLQRVGLGEPEDAIGETVLVESKGWTLHMEPTKIIGVIEDYARKPLLAERMEFWSNEDGVALTYHDNVDAENTPQKVSLLINRKTFHETLRQVENLYKQTFTKNFFNWYFLNDNVNQHYRQEKVARNQITLFALLAVGIACLGLLGMIANKTEEKTKEIGIRKVLGAGMHQIVQILLNTTIIQIAISTTVGIPVAHFLVQEYLQKFSERIALQWWHYTMPVAALLIILFITIATTLRKAVKTNPVDSLRYE